ncbi:extracellular solute-binding protein [Melissococcus plutonius]|uniref:extracellular solute-binding protein n=1 Tax=Melissococcus plutonius TaxID=33970 RepID=UPI003C2C0640
MKIKLNWMNVMKRNQKIKRILISSMMIFGIFSILSGCSTEKKVASDHNGKKDTISWMTMLHTPTPPAGDIQKQLEKYTGKKIEFNWVPDASKNERISAALSSKSLTDIISLTDIRNTTVRNALASGMFWDVEPYLKDYPNLAKISKERLDAARIKGKIYGVPFQEPVARYGILIRQDWLDNLGLKVPHTLDELEKVAQAFTEGDPNKDGKKHKTVGFVENQESFKYGFRSLTGYFGAGNWFTITKDENVKPAFMQPEYKKAMKWFHNIYKKGWMNSDFSVMTKNDQKDYIVQGKGSIVLTILSEGRNYINSAKGTDQEGMKWTMINDMTDNQGKPRQLSDTNNGMGGWMAISKQNVKTEKDLKVVLKFINDLMNEEPYKLMSFGEKDIHYKVNKGNIYEKIKSSNWQQEVQPFASSRPSALVGDFKTTDAYSNLVNEKVKENEKYEVLDPTQSLTSETYDSQ